jgi:hypothetical protein
MYVNITHTLKNRIFTRKQFCTCSLLLDITIQQTVLWGGGGVEKASELKAIEFCVQ